MKFHFPCTACGECCRHVNLSHETQFLDRGDGVCTNFDENSNLCSIYDDRPDVCKVAEMYHSRFNSLYTWDEYVIVNVRICNELQSMNIKNSK